ncbi:MAG: hypothetical protein ACYDAD_15365, partial [Acidimicrobiales bacterium]
RPAGSTTVVAQVAGMAVCCAVTWLLSIDAVATIAGLATGSWTVAVLGLLVALAAATRLRRRRACDVALPPHNERIADARRSRTP